MAKRRRLIAANWKMHGRLTSGVALARDIVGKAEASSPLSFDIVLCPPATLIWPVGEIVAGSPVLLGGQDCHTATHGAFTGDISASMLGDLGCRYVILGHSERRAQHNESDELIAQKIEAAQLAGLTAILCIGESATQLEAGQTAAVIERQLKNSIPAKCRMSGLVIAYEPIWAIGTGQQPQPSDIARVNKLIRQLLGTAGEAVQILYGGSVTPSNAESIMSQVEIDGLLVGGASLNADGFWAIAEKAR